jgi:hypothetical protein
MWGRGIEELRIRVVEDVRHEYLYMHHIHANFQPCKSNWDKGPIPFNHVHKIMVTCLPVPVYFSDRMLVIYI